MAERVVTGKVVTSVNGWSKVVGGYWLISIVPPRAVLMGKTSWHNPQFKMDENTADDTLVLDMPFSVRKGCYFKFK